MPPPFTLIFLFHSAVKKIRLHCQVGFADVNIFVFYVTIVVDKLIIPISYIFDIRQSEMKWTKRTEVKKNANSTKGRALQSVDVMSSSHSQATRKCRRGL